MSQDNLMISKASKYSKKVTTLDRILTLHKVEEIKISSGKIIVTCNGIAIDHQFTQREG